MSIILRPAQAVAVEPALLALKTAGKALVVMATGLGKTLTAALITKEYAPKKALFLVHNNFILEHAIGEFSKVFDQKKINLARYNGLSKNGATKANLVFATWQTMRGNLSKWDQNHFDLLIVDEAHHTGAETYLPVTEYFNASKLAITATPHHEDLDIREVFGKEVVNITLEEAIARGWLPRVEYHVVTDKSLDEKMLQKIVGEIRQGKKRFTMAEVDRCLFIKKREEDIAKTIDSYQEKAIVFCRDIKHAERMSDFLSSSKTFHSQKGNGGKSGMSDNLAVLQALSEGSIQKVCAVNAFNEGVDVPSVELVAFCRVTSSTTVFRQQLGRGLRPGKDKLVVLDFVGNLERVRQIKEMIERIKSFDPKSGGGRDILEVSGAGFEFTFSEQIVELVEVLKHCDEEFYQTWQEASKAAILLGIKNAEVYKQRYRENPKLPSEPQYQYRDFPSWGDFLATGRPKLRLASHRYKTWQEASNATITIGITSRREYSNRYKEDPRLPSEPASVYPDFPNWGKFLGTGKVKEREVYPTWQEASKVAKELGIKGGRREYFSRYREDSKLPSNPPAVYPDFPDWGTFLGTGRISPLKKETYLTWQEASSAAISLGIRGQRDYAVKYRADPKLHCRPFDFYHDFPGWDTFLGK